jgi:hypothetical protein
MAGLTDDMRALLAAGVAHQVGACTAGGRPVICRGLAADVERDDRVVVILSGISGYEVLDAIRETRRISLNVTLPENYRSLNLKGRDAVVSLGGARYRALVDARHRAFRDQLAPYGFPPDYTTAWYNSPDDDLMAVHFTPLGAWNQTPGPGAGNAVDLKR